MAARVGTTRSRINHFMTKFRKRLVEYNGELKMHSPLPNVVVRDQRARDPRTFLVER